METRSKYPRIGVALSAHPVYDRFLWAAIGSIMAQTRQADNLVLVYDGEFKGTLPPGWTLVQHNSRRPARNLGLAALSDCDWVVCFDTDNLMPPGYLEAQERQILELGSFAATVGFIYPDLHYFNENGMIRKLEVPAWDYWLQRKRFFIDTSSAWNMKAMQAAGSWEPTLQEDYNLAARLTEKGFRGQRLENAEPVLMRVHDCGQRTKLAPGNEDVLTLRHKSLAIIVSEGKSRGWRDNGVVQHVTDWLDSCGRNARTSVYVHGYDHGALMAATHLYRTDRPVTCRAGLHASYSYAEDLLLFVSTDALPPLNFVNMHAHLFYPGNEAGTAVVFLNGRHRIGLFDNSVVAGSGMWPAMTEDDHWDRMLRLYRQVVPVT